MKLSERTVKRNEIQSYNVYTMFPITKKAPTRKPHKCLIIKVENIGLEPITS